MSRAARVLPALARAGHTHLFFGLLYESVVRVPHLLSADRVLAAPAERRGLRSVLRPGSPALYFLPAAPVTVAAALAAAATRRTAGPVVSALATVAFAAHTAGVFQPINDRLFMDADAPAPAERAELLRRWYRHNALRLALVALAWATTHPAPVAAKPLSRHRRS